MFCEPLPLNLGVEALSGKAWGRCLAIFFCTSHVLDVLRTDVLPSAIHLRFQTQNTTERFLVLSLSPATVTAILLYRNPIYECRRNRDVFSRHIEVYYAPSFPLLPALLKDTTNNTFCNIHGYTVHQ
jgi:hypothetical protein